MGQHGAAGGLNHLGRRQDIHHPTGHPYQVQLVQQNRGGFAVFSITGRLPAGGRGKARGHIQGTI